MKELIFFFLLLNSCILLNAQVILNNSFEQKSDSINQPAKFWRVLTVSPRGVESEKLPKGITAVRGGMNVRTGKNSLGLSVADSNNFFFAAVQRCAVKTSVAKKIRIFT